MPTKKHPSIILGRKLPGWGRGVGVVTKLNRATLLLGLPPPHSLGSHALPSEERTRAFVVHGTMCQRPDKRMATTRWGIPQGREARRRPAMVDRSGPHCSATTVLSTTLGRTVLLLAPATPTHATGTPSSDTLPIEADGPGVPAEV